MTIAAFVLFCLWCGFVWRLRGGALATLLRVRVSTDVTRAICSVLIVVALAPGVIAPLTGGGLAIALMLGLMLAGWGPFQGMGLENVPGYVPEQSWLRALPRLLGLKVGSFWHDAVGMAQAGLVCMAPAAIVCGWATAWHAAPICAPLAAGVAFPIPYAIARIKLPSIPNFAEGQSWGEVGAGILVGAALGFVFIL